MSGGFFRGTSADQDTRFSNKQAKLMKSQKFPSELEHLVDITKVKMDVMKPWIAQRATELLGFEDEVLINFIYGLLDGKAVNGKEVQISLTGFMEKNTGKFMKELWQLLLSAQNNASGVPQQLLDAKEEETRKKQAESDKIKSEMQKKKEKEGKEIEEERMKKLDGDAGMNRMDSATLELSSKRHPEASYDKEIGARNGARGRNRASKSPRSPGGVSMSPRNRRSRSMSKSFSNSRSYSEERRKSRNLSRSPTSRGRSVSSERVHHSRRRRSITPHRKHSPPLSISPPIRRSSHSRRRSTSRSRRASPSPIRRRRPSPETYMSRSPIRRRSPTPVRRRPRSPPRYRSRSPVRRRYQSPRRRSPSPFRRPYRRSPSTPPPRSPSPVRRRSPIRNRRRLPTPPRHRSRSQEALGSPSPARRLSPSPVKKRSPKRQRSPLRSPRERIRAFEKSSPVRGARQRGSSVESDELHEGPGSAMLQPSVSLRSPQRDARALGNSHREASSSSPSPQKSQIHSKSPANSRRRSLTEDRSPYKSHVVQSKERVQDVKSSPSQNPRDQKPSHASPVPIAKKGEFDRVRNDGNQKLKSSGPATSSKPDAHKNTARVDRKHDYSPERSVGHHSSETRNRSDGMELRKKELESRSEKTSTKVLNSEDFDKERVPAFPEDFQKADEKIQPLSSEATHIKRLHETHKSTVKVDEKDGSGSLSPGSDDSLKRHNRKGHEYRKHRRSGKKEVTSDDSSDSEIEDRKVSKRRKKEEKRSRKEERRRRREERHRKREERRAEKLKAKSNDGSSAEETVPDQKKLEIQLREKALESLRAKKGTGR